MTRHEQIAIGTAIGIAIAGLAIAILTQEGHYFARSGALVSVIAIVLAATDLKKRLAAAPAFIEEQLVHARERWLDSTKAAGLDDAQAQAAIEHAARQLRADAQAEINRVTQRILMIELGLLIVGTLIWGFGDLPIDWVFPKDCAC